MPAVRDGVFVSSDNCNNWIQVNDGLTAPFVLSFVTDASSYIFAGIHLVSGFSDKLKMETVGTKRTTG